jgi:hypothetical protein
MTCMCLLAAIPARANDGAAALGAGGLVFIHAPGIAMQREDLTLSAADVRVRYEMRNDRPEPATLLVAFPLPEVPIETPGGWEPRGGTRSVALPGAVTDPRFIDFQVRANGQPVHPDLTLSATLPNGQDVTNLLLQAGGQSLLLQPRWFDPGDLTPAVAGKLRAAGAIAAFDPKDPASPDVAQWATQITYHWQQTFPPGVTVIEHSYHPLLGFNQIEKIDGRWIGTGVNDLQSAFCFDPPTAQALQRLAGTQHMSLGYEVAYILGTAATWDGPIGTFHLTLQGGPTQLSPGMFQGGDMQVISLCTDLPLRATAPVRFEATARDYRPPAELRVLFVMREPASR